MVEKMGNLKFSHHSHFNHYDQPHESLSQLGRCLFCRLASGHPCLLYEDPHCVLFFDKKQRSKVHI
jgi:hypothetical protein